MLVGDKRLGKLFESCISMLVLAVMCPDMKRHRYILLTKHEGRTGIVRTKRREVRTKRPRADILPVRSRASLVNKRFITRLKKAKTAQTQVRDHSGQCPVQYLENIGPAKEHFYWLIFVIGPLTS